VRQLARLDMSADEAPTIRVRPQRQLHRVRPTGRHHALDGHARHDHRPNSRPCPLPDIRWHRLAAPARTDLPIQRVGIRLDALSDAARPRRPKSRWIRLTRTLSLGRSPGYRADPVGREPLNSVDNWSTESGVGRPGWRSCTSWLVARSRKRSSSTGNGMTSVLFFSAATSATV
jgi:hypothetical protein